MTEYDNTNRGALFKNKRKETDNHPDYTGSVNVAGREHWLSAWIKKDKNDQVYMSLSVKPKDAQTGKAKVETSPKRGGWGSGASSTVEMDDEIPF